jgi:hypothetical protein
MQDPVNQKSNNLYEKDEVNLTPFFNLISKVFSSLGRKISYIFDLIGKEFKFLLIVSVIGSSLALVNYFTATPRYKTSAIFLSNLLSDEFCGSLVETLEELTKEKNYQGLSEKLHIPVSYTENIKRIKYIKYQTKDLKDTLIGSPFSIEVTVTDNTILDTLQSSIIHYLENSEYALKRKSTREKTLQDFSAKVQNELTKLDSLIMKTSLGMVGSGIDPIETYKKIISVYYDQYMMLEKIELLNNFEIISGFTKFKKPSSPRKLRDPVLLGGIFFLLGLTYKVWADKKKK